jgi:hypothetical protein
MAFGAQTKAGAGWFRRDAYARLRADAYRPLRSGGARPLRSGEPRPALPRVAREIAFLTRAGVDPSLIQRASADAHTLNVDADAAFLALRQTNEDDFYRALSRHHGLPFVTRGVQLAPSLDYGAASKAGIAPLEHFPFILVRIRRRRRNLRILVG